MPRADFFSSLGLLVARGFFSPDVCAKLRSEVRSAAAHPAVVRDSGAEYLVDEDTRRTQLAEVSSETSAFVTDSLLGIKPELERHHDCRLEGCQDPQFLIYREGDFFRKHRDRASDPEAPDFERQRKVAVVVFLNSESEEPSSDTYEGGNLTFYGLLDDERLQGKSIGFPLAGEEGLLIAFPTDVVHEVSPVVRGERYTIVTWYV